VEEAPARELFSSPKHPYTKMLLDAVPDIGMEGVERLSIAGEIPNPINPPPGCHFHPRCPHVMPQCRTVVPPPYAVGDAKVLCHLYAGGGTASPAA